MVIACIDFSNNGHRLHLMRSVIKSVLETGNTAICITNETDSIKDWIQENHPEHCSNLICHDYTSTSFKKIRWSSRVNDVISALHYWRAYNNVLRSIEREHRLNIDIAVLHYIDVFLACLLPVFLQKMVFRYRWAGLYLHPRYLRIYKHLGIQHRKSTIRDIDHLLTSERCVGVGVFDNGIQKALAYRLNKEVTLIPDITDVSTDNQSYDLVIEIKKAAKGNIIIGSIGMSYYSGTVDLIKLAKAAEGKDFFFVFCGAFDEESYNHIPADADKELLCNFRKNPPANCLWIEGYLKDEFEYNAVFNSLDIIYMMYPEHYTSSNRLTKAAFFDKQVLAANQYCVGENVLRYELGEIAAPGNIALQLQKLDILANKIRTHSTSSGKRKDYFLMNSEQRLLKQLKCLLNIDI